MSFVVEAFRYFGDHAKSFVCVLAAAVAAASSPSPTSRAVQRAKANIASAVAVALNRRNTSMIESALVQSQLK